MTLKNTTKIALLFSIMVLPLASSSAFADGDAEIVAVCGFDSPADVPLGLIVYGQDGDENNFTIDVTGNGVGTLELEASDWTGITHTGDIAYGLYYPNPGVGWSTSTYFEIAGVRINGVDHATAHNEEVDITSDDDGHITATFANKILNHPVLRELVKAHVEHPGNNLIITALEPGSAINDIVFNWGPGFVGSKLFGGGTDVFGTQFVLPAETTRYKVTTDGTASDGTTYSQKAPLAPNNQNLVLTTQAQRNNPINLTFQLTGIDVLDDVDYTGAISQTWTFTYSCSE